MEQLHGGPAATGALSRAQAARFLQQASFGPTLRSIEQVQGMGIPMWIEDQITQQPMSLHRPYIEQIYADYFGPRTDLTYSYAEESRLIRGQNCPTPAARAAISGPDQLRQRVAFALSQILVASRRDPGLENRPLAMTDYYDIFVRHAFGNFADILREVTWHPVMGRYLSHLGNQRARPEINQYPDENFAREVQQLFSIGLWELHPDGTRKLDGLLQPIPLRMARDRLPSSPASLPVYGWAARTGAVAAGPMMTMRCPWRCGWRSTILRGENPVARGDHPGANAHPGQRPTRCGGRAPVPL